MKAAVGERMEAVCETIGCRGGRPVYIFLMYFGYAVEPGYPGQVAQMFVQGFVVRFKLAL